MAILRNTTEPGCPIVASPAGTPVTFSSTRTGLSSSCIDGQ